MITEKEVFDLWDEIKFPEGIREHCKAVQKESVKIAERLFREGIKVNIELVRIGALLHDIGRAQSHEINHGLLGYEFLKKHGFPEEVCRIARNHIGAGIDKEEAVELGLPAFDFIPETLEEKIVAYADNLVAGSEILTFEETLKKWVEKFGPNSKQVERFKLLHAELEDFVTAEEMHEIDKKAVESGIPVSELMENAGRGLANLILKNIKFEGKVIVFSGRGNNGGDSLVAAHYLHEEGFDVEVLQFGIPKSEESLKNFERIKNDGIIFHMVNNSEELPEIEGVLAIDGLLGTGARGEIREPIKSGIEKINQFKYVVAVDIPSGINPDTGEESNVFVKPTLVGTMHKFKKGLVGRYKLGVVRIIDIGIR